MGRRAAKREKKRAKESRRNGHAAAAAVDLTELASPIAEPPPFPAATKTQSGFAPRMPAPPRIDDETLADHLVSLQPLYRATDGKGAERASELEVEDPSPRLDTPYPPSPLTSLPPPPKRSLALRVAQVAAFMFLAASSSYGVWSAVRDLRASWPQGVYVTVKAE